MGTSTFKYESKNAFDNDYTTIWHSAGQRDDALKLNLDTSQVLASYILHSSTSSIYRIFNRCICMLATSTTTTKFVHLLW